MRYFYFLLINFCSSHSGSSEKVPAIDPVTDSVSDSVSDIPDGTRFYIYYIRPTMDEYLVSRMDNRWRPFDDIAPLNVRKCFHRYFSYIRSCIFSWGLIIWSSFLDHSDKMMIWNINKSLNFLISSFDPMDETSMDFELTFLMRQRWQDPRLMFPDISDLPIVEGNTILTLDLEGFINRWKVLEEIWQPGNPRSTYL